MQVEQDISSLLAHDSHCLLTVDLDQAAAAAVPDKSRLVGESESGKRERERVSE